MPMTNFVVTIMSRERWYNCSHERLMADRRDAPKGEDMMSNKSRSTFGHPLRDSSFELLLLLGDGWVDSTGAVIFATVVLRVRGPVENGCTTRTRESSIVYFRLSPTYRLYVNR